MKGHTRRCVNPRPVEGLMIDPPTGIENMGDHNLTLLPGTYCNMRLGEKVVLGPRQAIDGDDVGGLVVSDVIYDPA